MKLIKINFIIHKYGAGMAKKDVDHMQLDDELHQRDIEHIEWLCKQFAEVNKADVYAYVDGKQVAKDLMES